MMGKHGKECQNEQTADCCNAGDAYRNCGNVPRYALRSAPRHKCNVGSVAYGCRRLCDNRMVAGRQRGSTAVCLRHAAAGNGARLFTSQTISPDAHAMAVPTPNRRALARHALRLPRHACRRCLLRERLSHISRGVPPRPLRRLLRQRDAAVLHRRPRSMGGLRKGP